MATILPIELPDQYLSFEWVPPNNYLNEEHQKIALQAGRESIVLLKNEKKILPLSKDLKSIAVIGPNIDNPESLYYFHYYPGTYDIITPLKGIKSKVSSKTKVYYAKGCNITNYSQNQLNQAIDNASRAELVILVLGITGRVEGEEGYVIGPERGDRVNLNLPDAQEDLLRRIKETDKPIILILTSGSALSINYAKENIPAILQAWYAGEKGGNAIADILFGDYNPAGRLPITFYQSVDQ